MTIEVSPHRTSNGWRCAVRVVDEKTASEHSVEVTSDDLERLDPGATDPTELVRRSFEFLLEREPPSSILAEFELSDIARYFPEYWDELARRLT